MKLRMHFSWKGLGSCSNMSGTAAIITDSPLHVSEALDQFLWEMQKEYPLFNYTLPSGPTITPNRVPPLWRRLRAKWQRGIHFGYLNTKNRDVIIIEVTR
ncbi:MAG: hypothetical protein J6Y54_06060 [Lentisphaeria bacterium]|nr:hypothetical protein [Lentisphaeria bacterium]